MFSDIFVESNLHNTYIQIKIFIQDQINPMKQVQIIGTLQYIWFLVIYCDIKGNLKQRVYIRAISSTKNQKKLDCYLLLQKKMKPEVDYSEVPR